MAVTMKINGVYSFNTIAPTILQSEYKNMTLVGIMTGTEAAAHEDVYVIHNTIRSRIANANVPVSVADLTYYKFKTANGDYKYLASEYLTGIQEVSTKSLVITIGNYTQSDYLLVKDALRSLGFENLTFELKNV